MDLMTFTTGKICWEHRASCQVTRRTTCAAAVLSTTYLRPLYIYAGRKRTLTPPPLGSCEVQQVEAGPVQPAEPPALRRGQSVSRYPPPLPPPPHSGFFIIPALILILLSFQCLAPLTDQTLISCALLPASQDLNVNPIQRCNIVSAWSLHPIVAADLIRLFYTYCCSLKFLLPMPLSTSRR